MTSDQFTRRSTLAVLVGAGAALSGCGGGGESAPPVQVIPTPAPTPAPPPAFFDPVYGTRYVDSTKATIWPQIYIDPFNGNDSADGTTRARAVRTKAGMLALPLFGAPGTASKHATVRGLTIGIVGHPSAKIREQFDFFNPYAANGFRILEACSWVRVGFDPVQGDCTDVAPPAQFRTHPRGHAIDWRHDFHEVPVCRFRVFINGRPLRRVATETQVGPGLCWYAGLPEAGVAKTIVFADFDGADPRSSGRTVEITARDLFISCRGGLIEGIFAERNGHNNGSLHIARDFGQTADPSSLRASLAYEGTKHNALFGHGEHLDMIAVNCRDDDFDPDGEVPILLTLFQRDLANERATLTRCLAFADTNLWGSGVSVGQNVGHAFLSHDSNAGGGLANLVLSDCSSLNLSAGWDCASSRQSLVSGHYSPLLTSRTDPSSHLGGADPYPIEVTRSFLGGGLGQYRWIDTTQARVSSCALLNSGTFSGGGLTTLGRRGSFTVEDTFLVAAEDVTPPFIDVPSGTLVSNRNVEVGGFNVFVVGTGASVTSDSNLHKPFTGGTFYCTVNNQPFSLAAWKTASGQDTNSQSLSTATEFGFASGRFPTPSAPDLNLTPGSPAATAMRNPLTPAEVIAMQARPATLAQARAYLLNSAPSRRAVRE